MTHAIEVRAVSKQYGGVAALADVSLTVEPGTAVAVLGPNGAGKSTLIRLLATLDRPSQGEIRCHGELHYGPDNARIRATIGVALQETGVDPLMTGREVLQVAGRLAGWSARVARSRATQLLERFQLTAVADRLIRTYSGGMRRRIDLAAALVPDPSLVILDEPTTGLDPENRAALWTFIRDLVARDGKTVLFTTQYLEEAEALCDRVVFLAQGRVVAQGSPADLAQAVGSSTIRWTMEPNEATAIVSDLRQAGFACQAIGDTVEVWSTEPAVALADLLRRIGPVRLAHLAVLPPTLEDVFRAVVQRKPGTDDREEQEGGPHGDAPDLGGVDRAEPPRHAPPAVGAHSQSVD